MLGGGVCFWSRPISVWGGVGAAKSLLPSFLVPKGNQPTACTLALWWRKFGPTEWWEGGLGCGGWGVLAWVRVWVRVVSLGFVSVRLWCCVCSLGRRLGFGVGFAVWVRFQFEEDPCPEV